MSSPPSSPAKLCSALQQFVSIASRYPPSAFQVSCTDVACPSQRAAVATVRVVPGKADPESTWYIVSCPASRFGCLISPCRAQCTSCQRSFASHNRKHRVFASYVSTQPLPSAAPGRARNKASPGVGSQAAKAISSKKSGSSSSQRPQCAPDGRQPRDRDDGDGGDRRRSPKGARAAVRALAQERNVELLLSQVRTIALSSFFR